MLVRMWRSWNAYTYHFTIPVLDIYSKESKAKSKTDTCVSVHSSIIYNSQKYKQPKGLLADNRNTKSGIYIERNNVSLWKEILIHAITCLNLEDMVLSEVSSKR